MNSSSDFDCKEKCGRCVYIMAVLGAFLIVAGLVSVMFHYTRPEPLGEDRAAVRRKALMELRASNQEMLHNPNYIWANQAKGLVTIPIDRAMELTLKLWQNPASGRSNLIARVEKATAVTPPPSYE